MASRKKQKKKKAKNLGSFLRVLLHGVKQLLIFVITACMVLTAVLAVVYRDRLNLDSVKRWVAYGSLRRDEAGQTDEFAFSGDSKNSFAALDEGLLMCSNASIQLYSSSGELVVSQDVDMHSPIISAAGSYAAVYDAGGSELYVLHGSEVVFSHTSANGENILSARVNESGYLAVVKQTSNYKAAVTVYDNTYAPRISVNESTTFVTDAAVSPDNHTLAIVQIYQEDGTMNSDLVCYSLSDASILSTTVLGEQMPIDLRWKQGRIWVEQENGLSVLDGEGTLLNSWGDSSKYLERYTLDGENFAVELMNKYKSGSAGELWVLNGEGQQEVSRSLSGEVLSLSAAGKYIAVLTTDSLVIYTSDLQEYAAVANTTIRRAIMREDGSAILVGADEARLFLP